MKITKVEVIPYGIPIKNFADAYATFDRSDAVLVKIYTDNGIIGVGESCAWEPEFYGETLESISSSITKYVAPKIVGHDPTDIDNILSIVEGTLAKSTCVKEGVDLALFDLVSRFLQVPVYTLLHGHFRNKIPVACEIGIDKPQTIIERTKEILKMGVKVIKIKCSKNISKDVDRVKAVHNVIGDKAILRLDPNAHWDTNRTIEAMRKLRDCNIQYLEQPIPAWNLDGMNRIRESIEVPLMADESVWTPQDVIKLANQKAADIVNIKISKTSGLLFAKKVEAVADALGLPCVVGTELEPGISMVAKIHLAASMKNLPYACEFTELFHLKESILKPRITVENGHINVPHGFGFGIDIDENVLSKSMIKF